MCGIGVAVQQAHSQRIGLPHSLDQLGQLLRGKGGHLRPVRPQSAVDPQPVLTPNQRWRAVAHQRVELGAILAADLQDVLEPAVGDQHDPRALPLEKGIGGDGGAVQEHVRDLWRGPGEGVGPHPDPLPRSVARLQRSRARPEKARHAFENRSARVAGTRRNLQGPEHAISVEKEIREGPARVHREDRG